MAENDVGGIGVKFTADAAQLKQELTSLEQRLRAFNEAHGQTKVKLQASLVMPGNRVLQDFRRDIEKSFKEQGAAGPIKARIELLPPTAAQIKVLKGQIGKIEVDVIGNFKWGNKPPKSVTVEIVEKRTTSGRKSASSSASTSDEAAPTVVTSGAKKPVAKKVAPAIGSTTRAKGEIESSRVSGREVWGPHFYPDPKQLIDMLLEPGGGSKRGIREELVRRGMTWPQLRAIESGGTGGTGGARGFVSQYMGSPIPGTASTGIRPPGGAQIKAMQRAGALPLPYADAGLYHPAIPVPKLRPAAGAKSIELPPEEWLEKRLDEVLRLTPKARTQSGGQWWKQAGQLIGGMSHGTGMTAPQAAGVAAQMTTRLSWPETLKAFDTFSMRIRAGIHDQAELFRGMQVMGREQRQITAILASSGTEEAVENIIRGPKGTGAPKIAEMYGGFLGRPNAFPFDAHMQRLLLGGEVPTRLIPQARDWATGSLRKRGMKPADVMPGIWETAGGGDVFGADPYQQLRARVPQSGPAALMAAGGGGARGLFNPYQTAYGAERRDRAQAEFEAQTQRWGIQGAELKFRAPTGWEQAGLNRGKMVGNADAFISGPARGRISMGAGLFDERNQPAAEALMQRRLQKAQEAGPPWSRPGIANVGLQSGRIEDVVKHEFGHLLRERLEDLGLAQARGAAVARRPRLGASGLDPNLLGGGLDDPERMRWAAIGMSERIMNKPPSIRALEDPQGHEAFAEGYTHADTGHDLWGIMQLLEEGKATGFRPYPRAGRGRGGLTPGQTTFGFGLTGGARGFAAGGGDDDPYRRNELKEQRERVHDLSAAKANADDSRHRESVEKRDRARRAKSDAEWASMSDAEKNAAGWAKSAAFRDMGIGDPILPGGQLPFGFGIPATPPAGTSAGRVRATPRAGAGGHQLPLLFPSALSAPPPVAGYAPGLIGAPHQVGAVMTGRTLAPPLEALHGELGLTTQGARFGGLPQQLEEYGRPRARDVTGASRVVSNAQLQQAANFRLASPDVDVSNLEAPAYRRRAAIQQIQQLQAAEPSPGMGAGPTLQEQQETMPAGGGGGGGGRPRRPAGAGAGDDEVGQPRPGGRVAELLNTIEQGKYAIQAGRQAGQIRAAGTTVASQLGGLLGRGVDVVKINEMTTILGKMAKVVNDNRAGFEALDKAKDEAADPREIEGLEAALKGPNKELAALNKQFQALQPNKFAQMATGLVSSIGGTIIGLGLFQGATLAIEGIGNALKEPTDRLMGFRRIGEQTGVTLGALTRQFNGLADISVAMATAQSGLGDTTYKQIRPMLEQRAAVEAGNTAFKEQLDLIRSAGFFERNPGAGITQTTGGLLGTPIGGTQPFLEQFLQSGSPVGGPLEGQVGKGIRNAGVGAGLGLAAGLAGGPFAPVTVPGGVAVGTIAGFLSGFVGNPLETNTPQTLAARARGEEGGRLTPEETQRLDEFRAALASVNDGLEKANPKLAKTAHFVELLGNASPAADAAVAATQEFLSQMPGITKGQLEAARDLRFAIIDPRTGKAPVGQTSKEFQRTITEAVRGLALPSREQAVAARVLPIQGQLRLNQAQSEFQRESIIPGESFLRQLAAGRAPGGARGGVQIANPLRAGTASLPADVLRGGLLGGQNIDTSQLTEGLSQVEALGNKGRDALVGMIKAADNINRSAGIPSNLLQQFNSLTEAAGKTAATIRGISQASAWMQVNLQVKQINEQIYLMSRNLEDAKSFLSGAGGGELGLLQNRARSLDIAQAELGFRQQSLALANQELGIAASTLQLQQRQRQINFQRAIAGFVTPGQTPEEIAARQKEATLEADFAQKGQDISVTQLENQKASVALQRESLGISKEQFAVQQAMITVSAERAVGDLGRAIGLLQEQARVTVQLQVNSDAVEAYQAVLEEQMASIQSVITEASNAHQTILNESAALITAYSGTIAHWQGTLLTQLSNYVNGATAVLSGFSNDFGEPGTAGPPVGDSGGAKTSATGFYGSVSGKTSMTVGEAGPETIAILRNPRSMTWGGNGGDSGGVNINIMVSGNNVGSEQDADELAATIARKVEETMSRRSSLLGLRPN